MRVYLAGPMRGIPEFNFPAFHKGAAFLRARGHEVFSPAEEDIKKHGKDISKGNTTGDESLSVQAHGFDRREALGHSLAWICAHADAIAVLPGWQDSSGATAEFMTARALDLKFIELQLGCSHGFSDPAVCPTCQHFAAVITGALAEGAE